MMKRKIVNLLKNNGFSLIELSVILIIIGALSSSAITIGGSSLEVAKKRQTEDKIIFILKALGSYLEINKSLPCPARSVGVYDENLGIGLEDCLSNMGSLTNDGGNVVSGMVPFKTLQISQNIAYDGWGRAYSYIIDKNFTDKSNFLNNIGSITIASENDVIRTNNAVIVVISYGANGYGAVGETGVMILGSSSVLERENNHVAQNATVVSGYNNKFIQSAASKNFDDIVMFRSKADILNDLGYRLTDDYICNMSFDVLNYRDGDNIGYDAICVGGNNESYCKYYLGSMVDLISNMCFH